MQFCLGLSSGCQKQIKPPCVPHSSTTWSPRSSAQPVLFPRPGTQATHALHTSTTKGAVQTDFWTFGRAELTCGEQMLIWQSSKSWRTSTFSIEFWNRLWKKKKFRWPECLMQYRTPKAFYKPGAILTELLNYLKLWGSEKSTVYTRPNLAGTHWPYTELSVSPQRLPLPLHSAQGLPETPCTSNNHFSSRRLLTSDSGNYNCTKNPLINPNTIFTAGGQFCIAAFCFF